MVFDCRQELKRHAARRHLRLRYARSRAVGRTCLICLRKFGCRAALMEHLHTSSIICLVNTMLTLPPLSAEEAEQEAWGQWEGEAANRVSGLSTNHSGELFQILPGPLQRMVIPVGHTRRSKHELFAKYLKCRKATKEVAFGPIIHAFEEADSQEELLDDVPLEAFQATLWL